MDLVRELKEVRFELSLRGYDCEAVDAFLARIRGDLTTVQSENDAAQGRISELEGIVESGGGSAETEGTLRRTLLLAQRLADETEAEAKKAAEELAQSTTAEAEQMRASAEVESSSMRAEGERELSNARDEAATIRETSAEEAGRSRGEARVAAEQLLSDAEHRGMERVAALEQTAQEEAAGMREPIRSEVSELEDVRARLLGDIAGLERHLEEQRVRVRTAVEALRVGMSGSIEDLERVAEDDDLLAAQPIPTTSEASGADVPVAPDIEIVGRVAESAPEAATVDDIEAAVDTAQLEDTAQSQDPEPENDVEDSFDGLDTERIPVVEIDDAAVEEAPFDGLVFDGLAVDVLVVNELVVNELVVNELVVDELPVEEVPFDELVVDVLVVDELPVDDMIVEDAVILEGEAVDDDVVVVADEDDVAEAELVELDEEPSALFGTQLASDAKVTAVMADPTATVEDGLVDETPEESASVEEEVEEAPGFVDRFTELLDALPIGREE
jgi:DivIVA domain-containing protein